MDFYFAMRARARAALPLLIALTLLFATTSGCALVGSRNQ
jgi:hypothetical protein